MHSTSASFMGRNAFSMYVAVHMRMHEPSHAHVGVLFTGADGDDLQCVTRRPWLISVHPWLRIEQHSQGNYTDRQQEQSGSQDPHRR